MGGIKTFFLTVVIFTVFKGYGCPSFFTGGFKSFRWGIRRPPLPDFKPISIPEFKPFSIPDIRPIPEFNVPVPELGKSSFKNSGSRPSYSADMDNLLQSLLRQHNIGDDLPKSIKAKEESSGSNVKTKTTRPPYRRVMATKDPLSSSIKIDDQPHQGQELRFKDFIKNMSPERRKLNFDIGYSNALSYHTASDPKLTALDFLIRENLEKWASSQANTDKYSFDYYTIVHYYHGNDLVVKKDTIASDIIVSCDGRSETICPNNTKSLCIYDGTMMCVAIDTSTVPCVQGDCIKSTISCDNIPAPECENSKNITIDVPCISTLKVDGDIAYKNNTITVNDPGIFTTTPKISAKDYDFTTPKTEPQKTQLSRNFCVGIVLSPTQLSE